MTWLLFFFFQAEDGIRDADVTGVQTCALPISCPNGTASAATLGQGALSPLFASGRLVQESSVVAGLRRKGEPRINFRSGKRQEGERGKSTVKVEPTPGRLLHSMVPPWARAIACAIERPRPPLCASPASGFAAR